MRYRAMILLCISSLLFYSCSIKEQKVSIEGGLCPQPFFERIEVIKWGMTKDEVIDFFGQADDEGVHQLSYTNKHGCKNINLYFISVSALRNVHTDVNVSKGTDNPIEFLSAISLESAEINPKETFRAELISRYGEPVTDEKLINSLDCKRPYCEVFRVTNYTVLEAKWNPASTEAILPDRLSKLKYKLAPHSLLFEIPRTQWTDLSGTIGTSIPEDFKSKVDSLSLGAHGSPVSEIEKLIGPPNIYLKESTGKVKLYYFWLTGSFYKLEVFNGKLLNIQYSLYGEEARSKKIFPIKLMHSPDKRI